MGDDGQRGDDAQLGVFQEGGCDQDAVDEVVKGVANQDQQPRAAVVMRRRLRLVRLAMIVVTMAPENQLFQDEENQDAGQHGSRHAVRLAMFKGVRQDFQKRGAEQGANGIGDQHADAMRAQRNAHGCCRNDAQYAAGQRHRNNPRKSAHELLLLE